DVPRIQTQPVNPCLHGSESELVLEVDVGHDRHRRTRHDLGEGLGGFDVVAGDADDVGSGAAQRVDLGEGAFDVGRLRRGHRLDGHGGPSADRDITHADLAGFLAGDHDVMVGTLAPNRKPRQSLIGSMMSRTMAARPRKVNRTITVTATGTSLRTSGSLPVIFCHRATAKCPPSRGSSGITLKVARITLIWASIMT